MQDQNTARIMPFNYEGAELRTLLIDDTPWFVAPDACRMLELRDTSSALKMVDDDDKMTLRRSEGPHFPQGLDSRVHTITIVNESGMWSLIFQSNKEQARKVRRWVTATVLPEIRKTGSFNAQPALQGPELVAAALVEANQMLEQRVARIYPLEQKVTGDASKVSYVDTYVADADCLTFSTVGSTLDMQESKLRELLIEKNWIYVQTDSRWSNTHGKKIERRRYSEKADKKRYFRRVETHEAPRFRGSEVMHTLKITPAGAEAVARLVAKERAA